MADNNLDACTIQLWESRSFSGKTTGALTGPGQFKLHDYDKMKDEADSLMTGPGTWAKCFDDKNSFDGPYIAVYPNSSISDLKEWNDRIGAVQLFDYKPEGFGE